MSKQKDREEFVAIMAREVPSMPLDAVRRIMREATTLDRLAVAMCNGDWPCDNGERKTKQCSECAMGYAPSSLSKAGVCPDCRAQARVRKVCEAYGIVPDFSGDPRGCVLKLKVPSGYNNSFGGEGLVCVP